MFTYDSVRLAKHDAMKIVNIFYSCYICHRHSFWVFAFLLVCDETLEVYESIVLSCFRRFILYCQTVLLFWISMNAFLWMWSECGLLGNAWMNTRFFGLADDIRFWVSVRQCNAFIIYSVFHESIRVNSNKLIFLTIDSIATFLWSSSRSYISAELWAPDPESYMHSAWWQLLHLPE